MKKITKVAALLTGFLLTGQALASGSHVADECHHIVQHLNTLAGQNRDDSCSGDVLIAAAYVEAASIKLAKDKPMDAILSLNAGQKELESLSYKKYCHYFADPVKPDIARIIMIRAEIDTMFHLNDAQSGSMNYQEQNT